MARHRWVGRASSRVRAFGREGARVHAAAGARTVAPPEGFWLAGWCPTRAFASADLHSSARFRALPHPDKAGTVSATVLHHFSARSLKPIYISRARAIVFFLIRTYN